MRDTMTPKAWPRAMRIFDRRTYQWAVVYVPANAQPPRFNGNYVSVQAVSNDPTLDQVRGLAEGVEDLKNRLQTLDGSEIDHIVHELAFIAADLRRLRIRFDKHMRSADTSFDHASMAGLFGSLSALVRSALSFRRDLWRGMILRIDEELRENQSESARPSEAETFETFDPNRPEVSTLEDFARSSSKVQVAVLELLLKRGMAAAVREGEIRAAEEEGYVFEEPFSVEHASEVGDAFMREIMSAIRVIARPGGNK